MEEITNNDIFTFDLPKNQSSYIKVIGVGGGGGNAVNHMYREGIKGVDFIVCNTDMKALNSSPVPNKIVLGDLGLGAGNKPERARKAALEKADDIREALSHNTQMLFITAGMGGGTGTGAAPVIAEVAKSIDLENEDTNKILVVAIVTLPFSFEGRRRREQALQGIEELRKHVDSILVINNDKLRSFKDFGLSKAFGMANDILLTAAKGIAEIITVDAYVNIDFQDVNTVMENSGTALMGAGSGRGENRAMDAITAATTSVLLDDNDIHGAKNVLLYFSYSPEHEITMDEVGAITDFVSDKTDGTADVIWGAGADNSLDDELKVTLIATGFEKSTQVREPETLVLEIDEPVSQAAPAKPEPAPAPATDEMVLIQRPAVSEVPATPTIAFEPATKAEKHVFVLEDEEPAAHPMADEHIHAAVASQTAEEEVDTLVSEIHLLDAMPASEPAPQPKAVVPEPLSQPQAVAPEPVVAPEPMSIPRQLGSELKVKDAAERIRIIHDMLRNNPNGAEQVQRMTTEQIGGDMLFAGRHSSEREASSQAVRPDGSVVENMFLFGNAPD